MIGHTLAHYRITAAVGVGGMGEVYRATDTKLGREVAVKRLPEAFAGNPTRLARFEREAQLLASLNHPNIAQIYGTETASLDDSTTAHVLVMELVEGEDLAERLKRGAVPIDEALAVATQVADALEAAHEKGIVHRDLKPANVKVTADGRVKVLDFGLAKVLMDDASGVVPSGDLSQSPTLAHIGTAAGILVGTASYMAPEQARGKPVDKRADIWAFGVLLWEMLTGRRAFGGETVSDTLAAVLTTTPDLEALPAGTPPRVRRLLERCLRKDPKRRLHDIADARIELLEEEGPALVASGAAPPRLARTLAPWAVAALTIAASLGWALLGGRRGAPLARPLALAVLPPSGMVSTGPIDLSVDGRQLAFTAAGADGQSRLYVRSLDSLEATALPGTEGADAPFFSPDGRSVGFFAGKKLKRIDLAGGPPRELADASEHRGGSWGSQGVIVFAPEGGGPISRVAASGGDVTPATALDPAAQETSHRWPRFLPDGERFLFMSRKPKPPGRLAVEAGSIKGNLRTRLADSSTGGVYSGGRVYFVRETTLLALALDPRTLAGSGDPVPVAEDVWRNPTVDGLTAFSLAEDGTLAYRRGGLVRSQLTWLDRQGRRLGTVGTPGILGALALSPDDRRALVDVTDPARDTSVLFALDTATGMTTRVSFSAGNQTAGLYSPDGRTIVFSGDARGGFDLYRQEVGAVGDPAPLLATGAWTFPESWSRDGRFLSYAQSEPGKPRDVWVLPMTGDGRPFPFARTPAEEWGSAFSPDGRFLAYVSDESGRPEVFVRTFPSSPAKWQVSTSGGFSPVWGGDGRELFYLALDRRLVAVPIVVKGGGLDAGPARPLFQDSGLNVITTGGATPYAATADGRRFLAILRIGETESSPIVVQTGLSR
ncbi:MAG TPA: protein kinase [Vicinamibacteria bacterium]|nr:protein kinase [Vicinamibacteria bacterium]